MAELRYFIISDLSEGKTELEKALHSTIVKITENNMFRIFELMLPDREYDINEIIRNVFIDGVINWGRILTVIAFVKRKCTSHDDLVSAAELICSITDKWIVENGGLETFIRPAEGPWRRLMRFCLGR